ncbi:hypothetical protein ACH5RR_039738 [Cinchona calisaya]|uniref:ENTH domain-containing protein n=1 Tax=Cinchona calisaya TaxID=153742 RepID=A0ABD2Y1R3_9GENT
MAEIAQATKKFSECLMVMNVLWARLTEIGKNWRFVYKALAVIEYLVAQGSERASLASFDYVEPSSKDVGVNVRKKAETIVALLNNKDKLQEVRNKAVGNRHKNVFAHFVALMTLYSIVVPDMNDSFQSGDHYGGFGSTTDGYKDGDRQLLVFIVKTFDLGIFLVRLRVGLAMVLVEEIGTRMKVNK